MTERAIQPASFPQGTRRPLTVSSLDNLTFLCGACAFPVWLASLHAAIFARRLWGVGLAAAAFAFAMLAGDFQAGYLYALTALPLMLLLGAPPIRTAATCAAAGLAGILLSSIQLLPTLSLLQQMRRLQGVPFWEAVTWSFPPLRLPELFLGDILQYQPFRRVGSAYLLQLMGYGTKLRGIRTCIWEFSPRWGLSGRLRSVRITPSQARRSPPPKPPSNGQRKILCPLGASRSDCC